MKNYADLGGCYPPQPSASADNTLLDLHNSSYHTQPHPIIANYYFGDRGPTGPAVQNNYVEPCALFLFTLPLVGIYATPAGAKMSLEL